MSSATLRVVFSSQEPRLTGRSRYQFGEAAFPHFLTCTVVGWLPLHKTDRPFQLWQEGSQPEMIEADVMLRQKLECIHNNPVKRGYVSDPTHWRYSSARNYAGIESLVAVTTDW
ncbi:MAG: hypothetical protein ACLQIB_24200 [Isosphaeraceae bacterium]